MNKNYLPKEKIREVPILFTVKIIALLIVLILIVNGIFYFYLGANNPNLGYKINSKKWHLLNSSKEKKDWLILGDSTCNQGLSVSEFEKQINSPAINLCTIGNMLTLDDSWLLEAYIEKHGTPENVLIIHTYDFWYRNDINLSLTSQLPVWDIITENPSPWPLNFKQEILLMAYKYFPLYSQNESFKKVLYDFFENTKENPPSFTTNGFMIIKDANIKNVKKSKINHINFTKNNKFTLSKNNLSGLNNIKNLSEEFGFNVFIANGPLNASLSRNDAFKSYFAKLRKYFNNYASRSDNVYYIDSLFTFQDNEMISADHVNHKAALKYTKKISEKIKRITYTYKLQ